MKTKSSIGMNTLNTSILHTCVTDELASFHSCSCLALRWEEYPCRPLQVSTHAVSSRAGGGGGSAIGLVATLPAMAAAAANAWAGRRDGDPGVRQSL